MKDEFTTLQKIERLTAYLSRLYAEGFRPVERWEGGQKQKDGSFSMPYPIYNPLVEEFFGLVSGDGWLDHNYSPEQAYALLKDESTVKAAALPEIRAMLTFCVRGERFSDGHWEQMIVEGHIRRLLERLDKMKSELPK